MHQPQRGREEGQCWSVLLTARAVAQAGRTIALRGIDLNSDFVIRLLETLGGAQCAQPGNRGDTTKEAPQVSTRAAVVKPRAIPGFTWKAAAQLHP